jgi:FkbH-like protein
MSDPRINQLAEALLDLAAAPEAISALRQRLRPALEGFSPREDLPQALQALYANDLPTLVELLPPEGMRPDRASATALNILLARNLCTEDELCALADRDILDALAPGSLLAAAQRLTKTQPDKALRLLMAAAGAQPSPAQLPALLGALDRLDASALSRAKLRSTRIALLGNCTLRHLGLAMRASLLAEGILAEIWEAPFDQWHTLVLDPASELHRFQPAFVLLYLGSLGLTRSGTETANDILPLLDECLGTLARSSTAKVILVEPESLEEGLRAGSRLHSWRQDFLQGLRRIALDRALPLDADALALQCGERHWFAGRYWYHAKLPLHPVGLSALGREAALLTARLLAVPVKVVVCDLDNTLWGGIVGEDGVDGVKLDVHGSGGPFLRLQAFLKDLATRGVILCVTSKNNEADVVQVFERRTEMLLKREDFAVFIANWEPKSANISRIAATLNLNVANFCFLDDSPFERAEVRGALPGIKVPELPQNAEDYVDALCRTGWFYIPVITQEDRTRSQMYRNEAQRAEFQQSQGGVDAFLTGLDMHLEARPIGADNIDRVVQLIQKTNQFNLTTRRHDTSQVQELCQRPGSFAYCYRSWDRFGDNGITAVLIALRQADGSYAIDTWLLSCRIMGRTMENAIFEHLVGWLRTAGATRLCAAYIETEKNAPVRALLPGLGFTPSGASDGQDLWYDLAKGYEGNRFVTTSVGPPPKG